MAAAAVVPYIMMAVAVAGTAYSVAQSAKAGRMQEAAAAKEAEQSKAAAAQLAQDTAEKHQRTMAVQEATYGASGLTQEGTPLLMQQESLKQSKEQLRRIYEAGENQSLSYLASGEELAMASRAKGNQAILSGISEVAKTGSNYSWW